MPKIIWMFWLQGWENATELSKTCFQSWVDLNPDWTVIPISEKNISEYLDLDEITDNFFSKKPISCSVDIINLNLLKKYGGIWVDSTVLCLKPLNNWLYENLEAGVFFYKFQPIIPVDDGSNKSRLLSTWFIAAEKDNYVIRRWCDEYNNYWLGRSEPEYYFDFHYIFFDLYNCDVTVRTMFERIPSKNAQNAHYLDSLISEHLTENLSDRVLQGDFEMAKYQNVYENNTYKGEEIVRRLSSAKHSNHLMQSENIYGLIELYNLTSTYYSKNVSDNKDSLIKRIINICFFYGRK